MSVTLKNQQLIIYENDTTARKNSFSILLNDPECPIKPEIIAEYLQHSTFISFESNDLDSFSVVSRSPGLSNCIFNQIDIQINRHTSFEIIEEFLYFVKFCFRVKLAYIRFNTCSQNRQFSEMLDMLHILSNYSNVAQVIFQYYNAKGFKFAENLEFDYVLTNYGLSHPADIYDTIQIDFQPY